jgi:hypothetical protein
MRILPGTSHEKLDRLQIVRSRELDPQKFTFGIMKKTQIKTPLFSRFFTKQSICIFSYISAEIRQPTAVR